MPTLPQIVAVALGILVTSGLALAQTNEDPQRTLWLNIKRQLSGPDGDEYFNSYVKNSALPPLKGVLITGLFSDGVSKLVLALTDSDTPDVTVVLHNGEVKVTGEQHSQIEFNGIPIDFTKDPFMLTFDVSIDGIKGLKTEKSGSKKAASNSRPLPQVDDAKDFEFGQLAVDGPIRTTLCDLVKPTRFRREGG
jgi:hypothetical protein